MLTLNVENFTSLAVVECKGRIVHSDDVFKLRDVVQSQEDAHVIVLDLSEVNAMGGGGLGMLAFLEQWARDRDIELKLFSPSGPVTNGLAQMGLLRGLEIVGFDEMMGLLLQFNQPDSQYPLAA